MYLIQYSKGCFVDGDKIVHLHIGDSVEFEVVSNEDNLFVVDKGLESMFLNHLQALNANIENVQSFHTKHAKE